MIMKKDNKNKYTIAYTSGFLDHYTLALGEALNNEFGKYYFIADSKLPGDRSKLGFLDLDNHPFVVKAYENPEKAKQIILNADVVLGGDYKYESHIRKRLKAGKITLYSSERLFKSTNIVGTVLRYIKYWTIYHRLYKNVPLLCVSAFAADDYNQIFGLFNNNIYKFGYFSDAKKYSNIDELIDNKKHNSILWVGRLITWKHPEYAIEVASKLKQEGYDFDMNIIGIGPLRKKLESMINKYKLNNYVHMLGSMSPDKTREHMEQSQIYLFTSDRGEGWGVVLNEAMNSGCVAVASYNAGATPYLINNGVNGLMYRNNSFEECYQKTKHLLDNKAKQKEMSKQAYLTMVNDWSPEIAAKRLYMFVEEMYKGNLKPDLFKDNVLSKAERLKSS